MRTIGVVTTSRADFGIYRPVLRAIAESEDLSLRLYVTGMHLSAEFGSTADEITAEGYEIFDKIESLKFGDSPEGIDKAVGLGISGFAESFAKSRPDILLVLGDRFEMFAAVVAALPFAIPVAHIHGGETTEGLIDEAIRHSITKMSHLHFVSADAYARRVVQMGEAPWRVTVSGAPSLDNIRAMELLGAEEIEAKIGMPLDTAPLLVTYHPVTLDYENVHSHVSELMAALDASGLPVVFTAPNADTRGSTVTEMIEQYVSTHGNARLVKNLGTQAYFSLMSRAAAMVGNSSSGIIEAASFGLPVVNIGRRQQGRVHGENVLDAPDDRLLIENAIRTAASTEFRIRIAGMRNPYGDGNAAEKIVDVLRSVKLDQKLLMKSFYDLPSLKKRIVFIGAVDFSAHCLREVLHNGGNVVAVVTPKPELAERNSDFADLGPIAASYGIPIHHMVSVGDPETIAFIRQMQPDVIFVFGLSQLIPAELLEIPPIGCVGTHPALLPKNRGRHPLIWALVEGLTESGLTFFFLDEGADSGDILWQRAFPIALEDDAHTLYRKIGTLASEAIAEFLPQIETGTAPRTPQNHGMATYWRKRTAEDGEIRWEEPTIKIYNLVRALTHPYVGANSYWRDKKFTVWKAALPDETHRHYSEPPGTVIESAGPKLLVRTGDGCIILKQYEAEDGGTPEAGDVLGAKK